MASYNLGQPNQMEGYHVAQAETERMNDAGKKDQNLSYEEVPTLNDEQERLENVISNKPAKFNIEDDPNEVDEIPSHERPGLGYRAVNEHNNLIKKMAEKYGLDPDLIRSVMWAENARGHKGGLNALADHFNLSNSALPMNMNKETAKQLLNKPDADMSKPENNIEAAAIFLKRLQDRVDNPTPKKIGSLWLYTGREKTNYWGAFIQRLYDNKPWKNPKSEWIEYQDENGPERETVGP